MALCHQGTKALATERLLLRRFEPSDILPMYLNWASDSEVTRYLSWPAHNSVEITAAVISKWIKDYEQPQSYQWAIVLKESGQPVGSISLFGICEAPMRCEIGYCLGKKYWGRGIMTECLKRILEFGFHDVGFARMQALHHISNLASGRVMQKAGMACEGLLRKYAVCSDGTLCDCRLYSILRDEWILKTIMGTGG